jgi:uncharacterized membrane protein YgcG
MVATVFWDGAPCSLWELDSATNSSENHYNTALVLIEMLNTTSKLYEIDLSFTGVVYRQILVGSSSGSSSSGSSSSSSSSSGGGSGSSSGSSSSRPVSVYHTC